MRPGNVPAQRAGSWVSTLLCGGLLVVAVAATFANVLDNGFVYDDQLVIVDDPAVRLPLSAGFEGLYYRPLRTLSYRLDHAIGGMSPRVFHLSNLVYHGAVVLLAHGLLGAVGASPPAALAGALVFAVHPVQADAVSYAAGRRDVLCGLFFVLGVLAYLRYRRDGSSAAFAVATIAYVLAILAKEMAVTLPVAAVLLDRWTGRSLPTEAPERRTHGPGVPFVFLAALSAIGGLALAFTYGNHIVHIATQRPWHGGSFGSNLATVARVWVKYLQLIVWPGQLTVDYSFDAFPVSTSLLDPQALGSAVLLAALAAAGWASWQRGGRLGAGLLWIAVTLLPVSHLIPFRELLAEHYLYIPMVGVALIVSGAVDASVARGIDRRLVAVVVLVVVGALAVRTGMRNRDWRDRVTLWSAAVAVAPRCARAQYNLGQAYFERTRLADAERAWLAAATLDPEDHETTRGLAMLYYRLGQHDVAAGKIAAVIAAKPTDAEALTLAGWIALDSGKPDRALEYFDAALAILPAGKSEKARSGRDRAVRAASRSAAPVASPTQVGP